MAQEKKKRNHPKPYEKINETSKFIKKEALPAGQKKPTIPKPQPKYETINNEPVSVQSQSVSPVTPTSFPHTLQNYYNNYFEIEIQDDQPKAVNLTLNQYTAPSTSTRANQPTEMDYTLSFYNYMFPAELNQQNLTNPSTSKQSYSIADFPHLCDDPQKKTTQTEFFLSNIKKEPVEVPDCLRYETQFGLYPAKYLNQMDHA